MCQNNFLLKMLEFNLAKAVKSQTGSVMSAPKSCNKKEEMQGLFDFFLIIVEVWAATTPTVSGIRTYRYSRSGEVRLSR